MSEHGRRDDFSFGESASSDHGTSTMLQIATPQPLWLVLGAAASIIGLVIALILGEDIIPAACAWVLSGPIAIGLLAVFLHAESKRHSRPTYVDYGWLRAGYVGALLLALVAVVVSAVRIALWVGVQ